MLHGWKSTFTANPLSSKGVLSLPTNIHLPISPSKKQPYSHRTRSRTHLEVSSHKWQHIPVLWPQSVCLWSRCHFYWSRQCSLLVSSCLMTPQPDPRFQMELNACRCWPEEREEERGYKKTMIKKRKRWITSVTSSLPAVLNVTAVPPPPLQWWTSALW